MEVIIERKHWGRGQQDNPMKLWDSQTGKYDVIGAMLLKTGYDKCTLDGMRYPGPLSPDRRQPLVPPMEWLVSRSGTNTQECLAIIELNDGDMPEDRREQALKEMVHQVSSHRVELQFCDETPIEVTSNSIYKMHRLGVNWEEFTRRVREDEIQTNGAYRIIERPLERLATLQYTETQHRVTRLFQPTPPQPPASPLLEHYFGNTVEAWPPAGEPATNDGWIPSVATGTVTFSNVEWGTEGAQQVDEPIEVSESRFTNTIDSWWPDLNNEETDESR